MEKKTFYKVVCIDENDVFEYRILEDVNKDTLDEVHNFVKENINKHKNARLLFLSCELQK